MKRTLKIILVSALATAALIRGVPALAEPVAEPVNVSVVMTADLDLTTKTGQGQLERRLAVAAHTLCGGVSAIDLKARNAQGECRSEVISAGQAKARQIVAGTASATFTIAAN